MLVIVPNVLRDEIYQKLDAELEKNPTIKPHRESIYADLLSYYNEHGVIPEFTLTTKEPHR